MKTLKDKYWQIGNIFEFDDGHKRIVWYSGTINERGFIPKSFFNDNLVNTDSTVGEHVIRIYSPNTKAGYFKELLTTKDENLLWQKSEYIYTEQEVKEKLGIPENEKLIIIKQ